MHCYARFVAVEIHTTHIETYVVPVELFRESRENGSRGHVTREKEKTH